MPNNTTDTNTTDVEHKIVSYGQRGNYTYTCKCGGWSIEGVNHREGNRAFYKHAGIADPAAYWINK